MSEIVEKFRKDMEGREMTKQEGNFSMPFLGSALPGLFPPYVDDYYDFDYLSFIFVMKEKYGVVFFDLSNYVRTMNTAFARTLAVKEGEKIVEIAGYEKMRDKILRYYDQYPPDQLKELSDDELGDLIKESYLQMYYLLISTVFCEALDEGAVKRMYDQVGGDDGQFKEFFETGSKVTFESFAVRTNKALLELEKGDDPYREQWLLSTYYDCPEISKVKDILEKQVEDAGGVEAIQEDIKKTLTEIEENKKIVDDYRADLAGDVAKLFDFMQLSMYIRDIRKIAIQKNMTLDANLTREIFTRLGIDTDDYIYAHTSDFETGRYKESDYQDQIEKRKSGVAIYVNEDGTIFETGNADEVIQGVYDIMDAGAGEVTEIKGSVGCPGTATAQVSVILSEADFDKFEQGSVLVASMTRPEFVPLMKKASAVITDEGGITCHAAIVSRELKIPCVIGTKNATRALKTGDVVEVDANEGVVRILE